MSSCPVLQTNQTRVFCIIISSILCLIFAPQMFKPVRIIATFVFLGSIALVFVGAFVIKNDVRIFVSHASHVLIIHLQLLCISEQTSADSLLSR